MITGRSASRSSAAARLELDGRQRRRRATAAGAARDRSGARASPNTWSSGKSRNVGPVCGVSAVAHRLARAARGSRRSLSAVAASLTSGATNGTWSISCSEPCPQRNAGARPPSTSIGEWFSRADAIALIPLVTPGPGGQRADAERARHLRPPLGGERGRLLVADVDDLDPLRPAAVVDREQVAARQREQLRQRRAARKRAGDQPPAVELRVGLGRHRAGR